MRHWLLASALCLLGCTSYPDVAGRLPEAEAWAAKEKQREGEERRARDAKGLPAYTPVSDSAASSVPGPRPATAPSAERTPTASQEPALATSYGTCFAIDASGTLVTARHVVEDARSIRVRFGAGETITATVVRSSQATDIAVLHIDRATPDFVPVGAAHSARLGLPVFTIGFPVTDILGTAPKFTDGTISALSGLHDEAAFMQTTVAVQPGNSGGPLMNDAGEVVGVVIGRASELYFLKNVGAIPQSVNFATKSENLIAVLDTASATRKPTTSRQEAIDRTTNAVCFVTVSVPSRPHNQ